MIAGTLGNYWSGEETQEAYNGSGRTVYCIGDVELLPFEYINIIKQR